MTLNLLVCSFPITSLVLLIFYTIREHSIVKTDQSQRIYIALLYFPITVINLYFLKLVFINKISIKAINMLDLLPVKFEIILTKANTLVIISLVLTFVFLIFFLEYKNFIKNIIISTVPFSTLISMLIFKENIISLVIFIIGTIGTIFLSITNDFSNYNIRTLTKDFFLQRVCDTLFLIGLFTKNLSEISIYFCFLSTLLRILLIIVEQLESTYYHETSIKIWSFKRLLSTVGPLIILDKYFHLISFNYPQKIIFVPIATLVLLISLSTLKESRRKNALADYLLNVLASLLFLLICAKVKQPFYFMAVIIPIYIVLCLQLITQRKSIVQKKFLSYRLTGDLLIEQPEKLLITILKVNYFLFNPYYINFIIYRVLQLISWVAQLLTRFFNNGNLQRSFIFSTIYIIGSFILWGLR